ncbi:hypothetical protein [Cecembia rubra]|uniref:Lipoprotein n=1 Tax=Cecembia rubra TaxID=1485585 RepID=A0A2P8E3A1_9BACT|nr:hypothetical protein [Cecembia rubra]PSL03887.1 hypothetical protein CLV48_106127 [Cecembia rubra]
MKRRLVLIFMTILVGCIETNPEPNQSNISDVSVAGFSVKKLGEEVSLFFAVERIPKRNKWIMVWKINGTIVHQEPIPKNNVSIVLFHRYKPSSTGQYLYEGCISNGSSEFCNGDSFSVIE